MDNLPIMSNIMEKGLNYMKYDLSQKLSRGAVRTINAFTGSMFSLLSEKSFESVSVNEICLQSGYPRATFYNYFDDKYDLLTCCWIKLAQAIGFEEFKSLSDSGRKTENHGHSRSRKSEHNGIFKCFHCGGVMKHLTPPMSRKALHNIGRRAAVKTEYHHNGNGRIQ